MRGLPEKTETSKQLPKKLIYEKFSMDNKTKERFDADIKRLDIVNEVSPATVNIVAGESVSSFFILKVALKHREFDEKNIGLISKLINQKLLFVLEHGDSSCLAIYHKKLFKTGWKFSEELEIKLSGLNLDSIWENIVIGIGEIQLENDKTLEEQIETDERKRKLESRIEKLEKQAKSEKQPRRKFELVQDIKKLKKEMEE